MISVGQAISSEMVSAQVVRSMGGLGGNTKSISDFSPLALRYVNEPETMAVEIIYIAMEEARLMP